MFRKFLILQGLILSLTTNLFAGVMSNSNVYTNTKMGQNNIKQEERNNTRKMLEQLKNEYEELKQTIDKNTQEFNRGFNRWKNNVKEKTTNKYRNFNKDIKDYAKFKGNVKDNTRKFNNWVSNIKEDATNIYARFKDSTNNIYKDIKKRSKSVQEDEFKNRRMFLLNDQIEQLNELFNKLLESKKQIGQQIRNSIHKNMYDSKQKLEQELKKIEFKIAQVEFKINSIKTIIGIYKCNNLQCISRINQNWRNYITNVIQEKKLSKPHVISIWKNLYEINQRFLNKKLKELPQNKSHNLSQSVIFNLDNSIRYINSVKI